MGAHWFEALADHMGPAYLRYSFTKGTAQEVGFLVAELGLEPGMRVLDVGCGPGRHSLAFAAAGFEVVGVDISARFVDLATEAAAAAGLDRATFVRHDARALDFDREFDAAVSLCQGAFGLGGPVEVASDATADPANLVPDGAVLDGIRRALRPGGRVALSAFSSYFQVRHLLDENTFHATSAVHHERTEVRDPEGRPAEVDLWTTCYTPRELQLLAERHGLAVDHLWSVTPGDYARQAPTVDSEEFLLVGRRPQ